MDLALESDVGRDLVTKPSQVSIWQLGRNLAQSLGQEGTAKKPYFQEELRDSLRILFQNCITGEDSDLKKALETEPTKVKSRLEAAKHSFNQVIDELLVLLKLK